MCCTTQELHFSSRFKDLSNARKTQLNHITKLDSYITLLQGRCPYYFVLEEKLKVDHFSRYKLEAELSSSFLEDFHVFKSSAPKFQLGSTYIKSN